jgi:hypothetical protein
VTDIKKGEQPMDRLTRMSNAVIDAFLQHPEHHEDDQCIVLIDDVHSGGIGIAGYDEGDVEVLANLLRHLKIVFQAYGKDLDLMVVDEDGIHTVGGSDD